MHAHPRCDPPFHLAKPPPLVVEAANSIGELSVSEPLLPALVRDLRSVAACSTRELLVHALRGQAFVHTKRGREAAAMAALNEAVEVATATPGTVQRSGARSASGALEHVYAFRARARGACKRSSPHWRLPVRPSARCARTRCCPTSNASTPTRWRATTARAKPRAILRQVLADQRALDVEETTRVRIAMTLLANALQLGGHLDEAAIAGRAIRSAA